MTLRDMTEKWKQFPIATVITSLSAFHIALLMYLYNGNRDNILEQYVVGKHDCYVYQISGH